MTSVTIEANGVSLTVSVDGKITTGMVGVPVSVEFDSSWDNLVTKVLFRVGDRVRVMADNTVPWELLRASGDLLEVGCEGRNEDGTLIIPTVWTAVSRIAEGASGEIPAAPTPGTSTNGGGAVVCPNTLIVTITDDVASHTSTEIYTHTQIGSVMLEQNNERWALNHCNAECAVFEQSLPEESVFMAVYVYTDGSVERFEVAVPTNYHINSLIDAKLGVIENGSY